jgi:hypothetical protein
MANQGSIFRYLKDSSGNELNDLNKTATFQSESLDIAEFENFGIVYSVTEEAGAGTFDVTVELSPDGGTTWVPYPGIANSETQAALAQWTADASGAEFWTIFVPKQGSGTLKPLFRFVFTAASSPDYNITAFIAAKNVARATDV